MLFVSVSTMGAYTYRPPPFPLTVLSTTDFILGDDDDDNGYIVAKDATSAAGTVVGDDPTERGAYLYDATKKGSFSKTYTAAGKFLKLAMSTTQTTYIKLKVIITGFRY